MALVAAAVCPHPPLLLPQLGTGVEVAVREPAVRAVRTLADAHPDVVVLVGDGPQAREFGAGAVGHLAPFGVADVVVLGPVGEGPAAGGSELPPSLMVGAWLLSTAAWSGPVVAHAVPAETAVDAARTLGQRLAALADRVALLCVGDGSARRTEKAPGWLDARAAGFDAQVAGALAAGDPDALLAVDPTLAAALLCAGRASWQTLAGAAQAGPYRAFLTYDDAPFGVGYFVAEWVAADEA